MTKHEDIMSTQERLIYMVNQIARNLAAEGEERAATMTAEHIRDFWDPKMQRDIVALAQERPNALPPIAARAVARLTEM